MNFARPVFLVRANLVFVGSRYKLLEYKASKASPFYTTVLTVSGLCIPQQALSARTYFPISTTLNFLGYIRPPRAQTMETFMVKRCKILLDQ